MISFQLLVFLMWTIFCGTLRYFYRMVRCGIPVHITGLQFRLFRIRLYFCSFQSCFFFSVSIILHQFVFVTKYKRILIRLLFLLLYEPFKHWKIFLELNSARYNKECHFIHKGIFSCFIWCMDFNYYRVTWVVSVCPSVGYILPNNVEIGVLSYVVIMTPLTIPCNPY